jgi:hypothetical protein
MSGCRVLIQPLVCQSADPFADLLGTIMSWLQQADILLCIAHVLHLGLAFCACLKAGGTLEREAVLPLIKAWVCDMMV